MFSRKINFRYFFSVYLLLTQACIPQIILATNGPIPTGARSWGMATSSVTLTDAWAFWNNVAGLASVHKRTGLVTYDRPFGMKGLQTMAMGYVHPLKKGVLGIGISRFGDDLYNVHAFGVAYSRVLETISLGVRLNYQQTGIQEVGIYPTVTCDVGGIATLMPQLTLGATIHTLLAVPTTSASEKQIPTVMRLGLGYTPVDKFLLTAEAEKDLDYPVSAKMGVEYEIVKNLFLRTGIHTQPNLYTFGIGIHPKHLHLDYAVRTHPILGFSHQVSVSLSFRKKAVSSTPS